MNIKSFLLGFATALAIVSGAHATDAVVPDPSQSMDTDHANACDAYGTGFAVLPGTETCVKVSGQVRFEKRFSNTSRTNIGSTTLQFETRSDP